MNNRTNTRHRHTWWLVWLLMASGAVVAAPPPVRSVEDVHQLLQKKELSAEEAAAIGEYLQKRYRKENLSLGTHRHLLQRLAEGGGIVVWALKAPADADVSVVAEKGRRWPMRRLGRDGLWVASEKFPNFSSVHYRFDVNGKRLGGGRNNRFGFESYTFGPDSLPQPGVPRGKLVDMGTHTSKRYYPGAQRHWWIYVPAQYSSDKVNETRLLVVQDGEGYIRGDGNVCTVLDNLIHKGKVPLTIAVFVNPGHFPPSSPKRKPRSNRSNEYDTCTPRYATFLAEEILPLVRQKYPYSKDPWDHAIMGASSGGSCAFTAAWHRNDLFRRVISFVGSFCDFRPLDAYPRYGKEYVMSGDDFGPWKTAHDYPALIRKTEPRRELKVFLQDGENDLDNRLGNWFLNNQRMAAALAYAGYDYRFVAGKGMHSKRHGMAILPEILEWIWQGP